MAIDPIAWARYKREHPPGSRLTGTVRHVAHYGVFVDLGVPYTALLEVPQIAPIEQRKSYPDDYPKVGEVIAARIGHYGD